ncbi:FtsX-like permease family protein [Candidatus Mycobacterium wuenschmannii]|uniref:FtsX-like permease family protein n=1 Tax=Candidatus Mycobacterium wuenschmannii TaxID=3027808 RepID=A0ABY8VUX7_9MYCO|nr:FtsX-like permease family protein [Candidatus Mycobacterium wuenschmannii]WIM86736.1 FtsX-like permease family protein [Candidatus Mycobacterium wuenschmannii]
MARTALNAAVSVLRLINFRAIRRHTLRALLASLSLGGGVAIVVAVMIETSSVSTAIDDVGYRIAGPAPLRIVGAATQGGIDPAVIRAARNVPGVAVLAPVVRAATEVRDGGRDTVVLALGIDCSARWIIDPKVCSAGQTEPQVMATSTTFGRTLGKSATLATDVGQLPLPGLAQIPQLDNVNNGRVVVLPLSAAKVQFARDDRADSVYVNLADTVDAKAIQTRLGEVLEVLGPGYRVLTRNDPAAGFNVNVVLFPLLAIFALIAVGVGVILIAQLTRLSIQERRREVAIAAALGASPLSTLVGFLAEAALLGAAGSVVGVALGAIIARPVVASASDLTQQFVGVNVPVVVEPGVVFAGLGIGVLLALAAAIVPSLAASKTPIATELSGRAAYEDAKSARILPKAAAQLAIGFAALFLVWSATLSGGLAPWQATIANGGVVIAIVGMLLAAAYFSAHILASIRLQPDRPHNPILAIAFTGLRADQTRTTAIAGAVAVPVAVATLLSGFLVAIDRGVENVARAQAHDRLVVTTTRFTDWGSTDAKFSPDSMTKLAALPGVGGLERMAEVEITLGNGSLAYVRAEDRPTFSYQVFAGQPPKESVKSNQLVIGGILARQNGIGIGDSILLGSGPTARRIPVGTIVATPEVGGMRIQMSYSLAEQIFGRQPPGLVFINPAKGVALQRIADEVKAGQFNQPLTVVDAKGYRDSVVSGESRFLAPLNTLKYGLLAIAFISVSSTLLLLGIRRRREIALIQALGATPTKVFAVTTLEAVIASATGALLGAIVSVPIIAAVGRAAVVDVGSVTPLIFPMSEAFGYALLAILSAVFAAVVPAWKTTQAALATQLRDE